MGMVVLNVVLNWLFIEGRWGFPRMELEGAGWATFLSRLLGMLAFMGYVHGTRAFNGYGGESAAAASRADSRAFSSKSGSAASRRNWWMESSFISKGWFRVS